MAVPTPKCCYCPFSFFVIGFICPVVKLSCHVQILCDSVAPVSNNMATWTFSSLWFRILSLCLLFLLVDVPYMLWKYNLSLSEFVLSIYSSFGNYSFGFHPNISFIVLCLYLSIERHPPRIFASIFTWDSFIIHSSYISIQNPCLRIYNFWFSLSFRNSLILFPLFILIVWLSVPFVMWSL